MAVTNVKPGSWSVNVQLVLPDGTKTARVRKKGLKSRKEAEEYEQQIRASLLKGTYGKKPHCPTFAEFAEEFMRRHAATKNKVSEQTGKKSRLDNHLLPFFGRMRLSEIDERMIAAFDEQQSRTPVRRGKGKTKLTASTINRHLSLLKKMLNQAKIWQYIERVPHIEMKKVDKRKRIDFLTFAEVPCFTAAAFGYGLEWWTMAVFDLNTGLRPGELAGLKPGDIDVVGRKVYVQRRIYQGDIDTPKSCQTRDVDLNSAAYEAMTKQMCVQRGEWMWSRGDGSHHTADSMKIAIRNIAKRAGLRRVSWKVLRHTFCSHLVMRGVPLPVVQKVMGHSDVKVTMRYTHLEEDTCRVALESLTAPPPARHYSGTEAIAEARSNLVTN